MGNKPRLKALEKPKQESIVQSVRIPVEQYKVIIEKANKYTAGNVCAWLRYTGLRYKPKANELG